jgi:hypothetical protein
MVGMVAAPDTEMSWVDIHALVGSIESLVGTALDMAEQQAPADTSEILQVRTILDRLFQEVSIADRSIMSVSWDHSFRMVTESVTLVAADAERSFIYRAIANQGTFENFDQYVPADATNFAFNSGANFGELYDGIKAMLVDTIPDAREGFTEFESNLQSELGIDFRADVLGWISGESISVTLPTFGTQPNNAIMLRVSDATKALDAISGALGFLDDTLRTQGQAGLVMNPASGRLGEMGFISVMHPYLGMAQMMPVIGVHDDYLAIGFTAKSLDAVYAAAAGDKPTILSNEEFQANGLVPDGPATSISYNNLDNAVMAFQQQMMMVIPMMSVVAAQAGPEGAVINRISMLANKVVMSLGKLDFFKASASVTTFDGSKWHTRTVLTYKERGS